MPQRADRGDEVRCLEDVMASIEFRLIETVIAAAAGGFMGAFGFWLVSQIYAWITRPRIRLDYSTGSPFHTYAHFNDGVKGDFIHVLVANNGRAIAEHCMCYIRRISLVNEKEKHDILINEPMATYWSPRDLRIKTKDIPPAFSFIADIAFTRSRNGSVSSVHPVFALPKSRINSFRAHIGIFELECAVVGTNFRPVVRVIRFKHDGQNLVPICDA